MNDLRLSRRIETNNELRLDLLLKHQYLRDSYSTTSLGGKGRLKVSASSVAFAVRENVERMESQNRFLTESHKLDQAEEQAIVEEWLDGERSVWTAD